MKTLTPPPLSRSGGSQLTIALEDRGFIRQLVDDLINMSMVIADEWMGLADPVREHILSAYDHNDLIDRMVKAHLLTEYQSSRIKAGTLYGLVLGNYRVLDRLGAGGMGIVFRAEHTLLRRIVAVKVLPLSNDQDPRMLRRFLTEMRAIAALQHPNIVAATDAGQIRPEEPNLPVLHYLAMEYVKGRDLENITLNDGPLSVDGACDLMYQVASALSEANSHNLVHRDIKPSNILVDAMNQAKLLDFGLAREFGGHLTEPGSLLGTIDYMAPEQTQNPSGVDIRADIYSLGATLYFCLTGKVPFGAQSSLSQQIARRLNAPPPSVRARRPELPSELDAVMAKMMAVRPDDRFQTPQALMKALTPFLKQSRTTSLPGSVRDAVWELADSDAQSGIARRVLIVDDESSVSSYCLAVLQGESSVCDVASTADEAFELLARQPYDLALIDVVLPGTSGFELLQKIRSTPALRKMRVIMMSGHVSPDDLVQMMSLGGDDYLTKPFGAFQLRSRVDVALRLQKAQARIEELSRHVEVLGHDLERQITTRNEEQKNMRQAVIQGLVTMIEHRTGQRPSHLVRMQHYCRHLAEAAAKLPAFSNIDEKFLIALQTCAPLYDLGLVALPDHVLRNSGILEPDERIIMQSHTVLGAELLERVADAMGPSGDFLATAHDLVRHHHEQFNGKGYPDRLEGDEIPLVARILAIADSYDALRSRRSYQPVLSHEAAMAVILDNSPGKYDPRLLEAFRFAAHKFEEVFQQIVD